MSELPSKPNPDAERAQERREMVPGVDVGKLAELVSDGVIPAAVLGLYEELATDDMERPLLQDFADAEPERQQRMLRALEKTARKVESLSDEKVTKEFQLSLMTLLAFVYAMFLRKSMSTRITTDATLDPGQNQEGALLRVLELNAKEVFAHPEKFEIKDFKQFLKDAIYKGHGREVLDNLGDIDAAYHADIIFDCLQVSRQKTGTLESAYVIDALAKCKQLTTVVAEQLCRLGFDHIVVERLTTFREEDLQDVVMLLFKKKKLGLREIMTATLDLPPGNLLKHVLISVCYLDKKLFASLLLPEHSDVLGAVEKRVPNLQGQVKYLKEAFRWNHDGDDGGKIEVIPDVETAKKLYKEYATPLPPQYGLEGTPHHPVSLGFTRSVAYVRDDVMRELLAGKRYSSISFTSLERVSDISAEYFRFIPLDCDLSFGHDTSLSPQLREFLREKRGWFLFPEARKKNLQIQTDIFAAKIAKGDIQGADFSTLTKLGVKCADRLQDHKGVLHLDGLRDLSEEEAKLLLKHKDVVTLNGLEMPEDGQFFSPAVCQLLYKSLKEVTEMSPAALQGAMQVVRERDPKMFILPRLQSLTERTAAILSEFTGSLDLPELVELTEAQAIRLAEHKGDVLFLGLRVMEEGVARALARYRGEKLKFLDLRELSEKDAQALASYRGAIDFMSLERVSQATLERLSTFNGALTTPLLNRKTTSAEQDPLYQHRGWYPDSYVTSDDKARQFVSIGDFREDIPLCSSFLVLIRKHFDKNKGILQLDGRTSLTDRELLWLQSFEGSVSLKGLKTIGTRESAYLKNFKGILFLHPTCDIEAEAQAEMSNVKIPMMNSPKER